MSAPDSSSMAPPPVPSAAISSFTPAAASQPPAQPSQPENAGAADGDAGGSDSVAAAAAAAALVAMPSNTTSTTAPSPSPVPTNPSASAETPASSAQGSAPRKPKATSSPSAATVPSSSSKSTSRLSPSHAGTSSSHASKRRKVSTACIYCRRSHMTCDEGRPCQRCIKRDIGHLCHDEATHRHSSAHAPMPAATTPAAATSSAANGAVPATSAISPTTTPAPIKSQYQQQQQQQQIFQQAGSSAALEDQGQSSGTSPLDLLDASRLGQLSMFPSDQSNAQGRMPGPSSSQAGTDGLLRYPEDASNNILSAAVAAAGGHNRIDPSLQQLLAQAHHQHPSSSNPLDPSSSALTAAGATLAEGSSGNGAPAPLSGLQQSAISTPPLAFSGSNASSSTGPHNNGNSNRSLPAGVGTKAERFLITAADQTDGTRDERLRKVIHAKYDAGLLRPYNYVNGYHRLNRWMEKNVSPQSRRRILKPLSVFRPAFRAIAQSLTNVDLLIIEEHFERLLLDYDRVFSTQGIPACLWRRTGEIYKGNKEFANLIGVNIDSLRDGRLCIYELMAEESAVNYWEKYGAVSFDPGQKAVLTSCVLRARTQTTNSSAAATGGGSSAPPSVSGDRTGSGSVPSNGNAVGGTTPSKSHRSLSISSATGNSAGSGNGASGSGSSGANASGSGRPSSSNRLAPMTPLVSNKGADANQTSGNGQAAGRNARSRADSNNQDSDAGQDAAQAGESAAAEGGPQSSRMEHTSTAMLNMLSSLSSSSTDSFSASANRPPSANGNHANNGQTQQQQDMSAALLKTPSQQHRGSGSSPGTATAGAGGSSGGEGGEEVLIPCCFSFTIRRDQWNIPICIVGNFLMIDPP